MSFDPRGLPDVSGLTVGVLGGTGPLGRGLAYRFARAGQRVRVGSRSTERGARAAAELARMPGVVSGLIRGGDNAYACDADVVIVAVPWEGYGDLLASLAGPLARKIVVGCVNPLGYDEPDAYVLPVPEGSAAQHAAALLPRSRVCAAFHHVSAALLLDPDVTTVELDVLVLGDDREAVAVVQSLAGRIEGMRGLHAGHLRNAGKVERLTANLIAINKRYRARPRSIVN
jgi:NADPH-dependent F420 reductase